MKIKDQLQTKNNNSLFPSFKKQVLKSQDAVGIKREEITETVSFFSTILIILTNMFWLIYDIAAPFIGITSSVGVLGLTIIAFLYLVFEIVSKRKELPILLRRIVTDLYCIGIVGFTLPMIIENNINIVELGITPTVVTIGVGLQTFYLFILVFTTFYSWIDTSIVILSVVVSFFVPFFTPGANGYPWAAHLIVRLYLLAVYLVYLFLQKHLSKKDSTIDGLNERLLSMSYTDSQTGTFNKRALYEYIDFFETKFVGKEVGVFMMDLDDFKSYNDNYTHIKGDQILNKVSQAVMDVIGEEKNYLFRYGGEEFVFFISKPTKERVEEIGTRVLEAVRLTKQRRTDTEKKVVTVTIGASIERIESIEKDYLFNADSNLYKGKDSGKDCLVLDDKIIR